MKYQSELIKEIVDTRGHEKSSLHYESECVDSWIEETKGAYPKLCDYQSEWLNYINENPIGNFPYEIITDVTEATVNNVVPYAYKSAILSGNTLVNIENTLFPKTTGWYDNNGVNSFYRNAEIISMMNPNTDYLLYVEALPTVSQFLSVSGGLFGAKTVNLTNGKAIAKVTTTDVLPSQATNYFKSSVGGNLTQEEKESIKLMIIKYQDGMENWDIPYFDGIQSVKMPVLTTTGKNLFDINNNSRNLSGSVDNFQPLTFEGNQVSVTSKFTCSLQYLVKLKPNTKYTVTVSERNEHNNGSQFRIARYSPTESSFTADWNNLFADIHLNNNKSQSSFVTDATGYIVAVLNPKSGNEFLTSTFYNIQLEEGSSATSCEPHKSNILTVNEDVTLRSNGDICDELNLLTGQLTQRVGEDGVVLSQEVVKTVDLNIQDQDGNTLRKIKPIEGTMHIHSDGTPLKPTITMEIPVEATTQNLASFTKED